MRRSMAGHQPTRSIVRPPCGILGDCGRARATIAASVGIVAHYLALRPELQDCSCPGPHCSWSLIIEILRIHAPFDRLNPLGSPPEPQPSAAGRSKRPTGSRRTPGVGQSRRGGFRRSRRVLVRPRPIAETCCTPPCIDVCPGPPLARVELRIVLEELLARTSRLAIAAVGQATGQGHCRQRI